MKGISNFESQLTFVSLKFRMILIIFVCDRTGFHELNCEDEIQEQADSLRSDAVQSVGADAVESSEESIADMFPPAFEESVGADAVESSEARSPKGPLPNPESPELDDETKEWSEMSDGEQEAWMFSNRSKEQAERWMRANREKKSPESEMTITACCTRGLKRTSNDQEQHEQSRLPVKANKGIRIRRI